MSAKLKILIVLFLAWTAFSSYSQNSTNFEISKNLDIYATLINELNQKYVDEIKPGELTEAAIDAMLKTLDPYTNYIPESEVEDYRFMTTGEYGGIGALIHQQGDHVVISEPYEGFPAQKAGLIAGDKIVKINDESAVGKSSSEVSSIMKGQPGTAFTLTVERPGKEDPITTDLTREKITVENIPYYGVLKNDIGYIKLTSFTNNAGKEVKEALIDLKTNHNIKSLILDLRGNGGGLLHEAVNIVNLFVPKGELVVSTKGKQENRNKSYKTLYTPVDTEMPLVVMVDGASASASEIVSGAIQDFDRGVVIGQKTFGKGLVQNVIPLSYNSSAKVTVAKYYIPSGRCIQSVDYSKKNGNGKSEKIPDSLFREFKTKNGRIVHDKGGIEPDIELKPEELSELAANLFGKYLIFDFATQYYLDHPELEDIHAFRITDPIYNDFVEFVRSRDFEYTTQSEKTLKELIEIAKEEKYSDDYIADLQQLLEKAKQKKKEDFDHFRGEISRLLRIEIASRYYYREGKVIASLDDDPEVAKGVEILTNPDEYNKVLEVDMNSKG